VSVLDDRFVGSAFVFARLDPTSNVVTRRAPFPITDVFSHFEIADGRVWMKPSGVALLRRDLPEQEQKVI
jgi:hypothetical protein